MSVALAVALAPGAALALRQSVHEAFTHDACVASGLPGGFCEAAARAAHNVDGAEWTDPAAHAQLAPGDAKCAAADDVLARLVSQGRAVRNALDDLVAARDKGDDAAVVAAAALAAAELGRGLHTVQDSCAHDGMTNPQHAWHTTMDYCRDTGENPDATPWALACAQAETIAVFAALAAALPSLGVTFADLELAGSIPMHDWPTRGQACEFFDSTATWDGMDTRWNGDLVIPAVRAQYIDALTVEGAATIDPCGGDPAALDRALPPRVVDTSGGGAFCVSLELFCTGDVNEKKPPPWETAITETASDCGCRTGGTTAPAAGLLAWLALVVAWRVMRR